MGKLSIERLGGFAGFGPGSHLRSIGEVDLADLADADRAAMAALFDHPAGASAAPPVPDGFRYRLTRTADGRTQTVEVPEAAVPEAIRNQVHDELR